MSRHRSWISTYNILSSSLAKKDYQIVSDPKLFLDPNFRINNIKSKLQSEIEKDSVICLQEVCRRYKQELHPFFMKNKYHFINNSYGSQFNGDIGTGIAVPCDKYEILDMKIDRLSDMIPTIPQLLDDADEHGGSICSVDKSIIKSMGSNQIKTYKKVKGRKNLAVYLRLKNKYNDDTFCVGTYHMPCYFFLPSVMVSHAALLMQGMYHFSDGDKYVIAGDFNITPGGSLYKMFKDGTLPDKKNKMYPNFPHLHPQPSLSVSEKHKYISSQSVISNAKFKEEEEEEEEGNVNVTVNSNTSPSFGNQPIWEPSIPTKLKSAYFEHRGKEPPYTNFVRLGSKHNPCFIGTLDYLFMSPTGVTVHDTVETPKIPINKYLQKDLYKEKDSKLKPQPNKTESSDHLLLGAEFSFHGNIK